MLKKLVNRLISKCGRNNVTGREAWLKKTILNIPENSRILDAGAGELQYKNFCSHLDYVSQDLGEYDGIGNIEGLQTGNWDNTKLDIKSDITDIPEKDNSFDAVMCIEVFEHLPEPVLAIKEFSRLIKPGGKLIITAPFLSLTHFAPFYFHNGFSKFFFEKFLKENGFEIEEISFNGNYFDYMAQEYFRIPQMAEKYAVLSTFDKIKLYFILPFIIRLFNKLSDKDTGSCELLAFGIHVVARKL